MKIEREILIMISPYPVPSVSIPYMISLYNPPLLLVVFFPEDQIRVHVEA
jgi:hypothetical protein